ncbi:MAG: alpha-ketoglutarate-dependent dioxygenase AlkB [Roseivirga sp.]|nr:alpha-ketoglutarate-dependent dioxygenase AlkB [Roseivirga sp.]
MKLPLNCDVEYLPEFLTEKETGQLYDSLINQYGLDKSRLIIDVEGQRIETDSFKILFATERLMNQRSHLEKAHGRVFQWEGLMQELRTRVEEFTGKAYEVAMCIYYPDGNSFAPYHYDPETSGAKTVLPSLSLGAVREFAFKESDSGEVYSLNLANGSLLVMADYCQQRYVHSLLKDETCKAGRINITFRESAFA